MDFTFTDEQQMMAGILRDLLDGHCGAADLRAMADRGEGFDPARWARLADLGLAGILVPEAAGGLGLAEADFVQIASACGHALLPEPLVDLAGVALPLLAACGGTAQDGEIVLWADGPLLAQADRAARLIVTAPDGALHLVERAAAQLTAQPHVDPLLRLFSVTAELTGATRIAPAGSPAAAQARNRGALFAAAQLLGLAQRAIDLATAYACERSQFGRPIGSYQAIKHHLASAQVKVEFARPVVHAACAATAPGPFNDARVSHALLAAAGAADFAARQSLQVHGAMGYSWEVDVHFCLKRALWLTHAWGSPALHRDRVARRAMTLPLGPDTLFQMENTHG